MNYVKFFDEISIGDIAQVGGKNANLGEMVNNLKSFGIRVPNGFALTSNAYKTVLKENHLVDKIKQILEELDISDIAGLSRIGKKIRDLICNVDISKEMEEEIIQAYRKLSLEYKTKNLSVAIRSSATAEDLPDASFAGQQNSYLNICNEKDLIKAIKNCYASLFNDRAISYRSSRNYSHFDVALSVGVQKMVRSDRASSGIMFTIDTENASENIIMINSSWGLGENVVGGKVNPDEFYVFKPTLKLGISTIIKHQLGSKELKMIYSGSKTKNIKTTKSERETFSINNTEIMELAKAGLAIENYYTKLAKAYRPMDIEWAKDADDGLLYIVQARPETVQSKIIKDNLTLEKYKIIASHENAKILVKGRAIGEKVGVGKVRVIKDVSSASTFLKGEVLVADITDPDWEPIMKKASAVVTNKGGRTCHAAIVAREIGVPAIVGTSNATDLLRDGDTVTVSCCRGEDGYVYEGALEYKIEKIDLKDLKPTKTKLFMNVGDPRKAFSLAKLPNCGVGLARMEFIINNYIKAHPMALFNMYNGQKVKDYKKIKEIMVGFDNPKSFFITRLSEGIATIAAAFYPKPVIVRTSDFKSNEYKNMLGGRDYEKDEENPMIGFRGASRYYSKEYIDAFKWECEALKFVRDEMGLTNVKVMIPFVRTPDEGKKVIEIMKECGLVQGLNDLEVYAMCEIPSNVILADEFLKIFDGYSIGSNDLTQLTLGVDRDSALISHIFDERNSAITKMLAMVIEACKKNGKYIGICGQAPSDYPEITEFLVKEKIESISLNPDSILKMWQLVMKLEA